MRPFSKAQVAGTRACPWPHYLMKLSILCSLCDKNNGPGAGGVAAAVGAGMLVGGVAAVAASGGFGDMGNIAGKTLHETLSLLYVAETPRNVAEASSLLFVHNRRYGRDAWRARGRCGRHDGGCWRHDG
jgi:hypothetical protein